MNKLMPTPIPPCRGIIICYNSASLLCIVSSYKAVYGYNTGTQMVIRHLTGLDSPSICGLGPGSGFFYSEYN